MTPLRLASWLALIAACAGLGTSGLALARARYRQWASRGLWAAWGAATLALVLLAEHVLSARLGVFYVWENVEAGYPWWLRMASLWGGQEGTFLLWAWGVLGVALAEDHRTDTATWRRARLVLLAVAVAQLVPVVLLGLGSETLSFGLTGSGQLVEGAGGPSPLTLRPGGEGLNPLLETPYMAIHPLLEFLAYGLMAVPFAYGLVGMAKGGEWQGPAEWWGRRAWLMLLAALTVGALWAYHVLSFGGYWIWDPVEVANLLPLLALTVFLHAAPARKGDTFHLLAPAAAALAFTMVVFTDFVVRSGLWSSVHAFLPTGVSASVPDPGRRLLVAMRASFPARYATSLLAATLGAFGAAGWAFHVRTRPRASLAKAAALAGVVASAAVGLAGLLVPEVLVGLLARLVHVLGFGDPVIGGAVLVALAALPLVVGLFWMPDEVPTSLRSRPGQLVLAVAAIALIFAATALLLVLGVNGYGEDVFTSRAPLLAAPVLALVGLTFRGGRLGRWAGYVAAGLVAGLALRWLAGSWAWAAVPAVSVPLAGTAIRYAKRARPTGNRRSRARVLCLAGAGLAGLVHWASPGAVTVAGTTLASPLRYAPVGLLAGALAVAAPALEGRSRWPRWLGPAAGVLAVGYGLGALLALAAAWLGRGRDTGPRGRLRAVGLPVVHAGLAVLLLGVAVSTYGATAWSFPQSDPLVRGEPAEVGGQTVELVDGRVVDTDGDGRAEEAWATVHVRQDGAFVSEERLSLSFHPGTGVAGMGSMVPDESPVTRGWAADLAHNADTSTPLSLKLADGNGTWVAANGPAPPAGDAEVRAVSMGVERLPAANLVWAGAAMLALGVGMRLAPGRD